MIAANWAGLEGALRVVALVLVLASAGIGLLVMGVGVHVGEDEGRREAWGPRVVLGACVAFVLAVVAGMVLIVLHHLYGG